MQPAFPAGTLMSAFVGVNPDELPADVAREILAATLLQAVLDCRLGGAVGLAALRWIRTPSSWCELYCEFLDIDRARLVDSVMRQFGARILAYEARCIASLRLDPESARSERRRERQRQAGRRSWVKRAKQAPPTLRCEFGHVHPTAEIAQRCRQAFDMRAAGATFQAIGERFGISGEAARNVVIRCTRLRKAA